MDITNEEDVTMTDAKRIMEERKSERDLVYDQKICLDYLEKVSTLTDKQTQTVVDELTKIQILKPRYIALILNTMPDTEEEVEALFAKERTNLKKEEVKQIVTVISKFKK
jgi:DNA-directed RNA polymerase subunit F